MALDNESVKVINNLIAALEKFKTDYEYMYDHKMIHLPPANYNAYVEANKVITEARRYREAN